MYACGANNCLTRPTMRLQKFGSGWKPYNADGVHAIEPRIFALLHLRENHVIETLASVLLHTLEAEAHVHGKRLLESVMRFEDIHPSKYRTLVV